MFGKAPKISKMELGSKIRLPGVDGKFVVIALTLYQNAGDPRTLELAAVSEGESWVMKMN